MFDCTQNDGFSTLQSDQTTMKPAMSAGQMQPTWENRLDSSTAAAIVELQRSKGGFLFASLLGQNVRLCAVCSCVSSSVTPRERTGHTTVSVRQWTRRVSVVQVDTALADQGKLVQTALLYGRKEGWAHVRSIWAQVSTDIQHVRPATQYGVCEDQNRFRTWTLKFPRTPKYFPPTPKSAQGP